MTDGNGEVGRAAKLEGMETEFADLGQRLVQIHRRVQALTLEQPSESRDHELEVIQQELYEIFDESFISNADPARVLNFVMYLVDQVSAYAYMKMHLGQALNAAGTELNKMAETLGMQPLVGGGPVPIKAGFVKENNTYITGTGQILGKIHAADKCRGWCVIHNPLPGPWADWPTNWRGDGLFDDWRGFERICPCGVGHTAMEHVLHGDPHPHGCCGLCPCGPPMAQPIYDPGTQEIVGYQ